MLKIHKTIHCSGDLESSSKHPTIYIKLDKDKKATCPYCSKYFLITKKNNKTFVAAYDPSKD